MGDSEPSRKKAISAPRWQQQSSPETSDAAEPSSAAVSRSELLEQASRFLEADEIREASRGRKVAFLESKGLTNEEIQKLLGDAHSSTSDKVASPLPAPQVINSFFQPHCSDSTAVALSDLLPAAALRIRNDITLAAATVKARCAANSHIP
jgi:hypothetical protein